MRGGEAEAIELNKLHLEHMRTVLDTLKWLQANERTIKAKVEAAPSVNAARQEAPTRS